MEQLSIFSNGGETKRKTLNQNTDDLVKKHLQDKIIYQARNTDDDLLEIVNNNDFFIDDLDSNEFCVCVDFLKENRNDEYKKINIADIKHKDLKKHIPIDKYLEIHKAYGGSVDKEKIAKVMHEFKVGKLYSSSGDKVTDRKQAIAIALSEARRDKKEMGGYANVPVGTMKSTKMNETINDFRLEHFYKYMESELKYFLRDTLGVELKKDGVFLYNNEMYYIRPYLRKTSDGKILKDATLSIQNRGREVGEIIFNPALGDKKFLANSELFNWDNYEFKAGGVAYSIPYNYKILGIYQVVGKNINEKIEIVGFEKENDTSYSFYQPLYGNRKENIGSLIVPFSKIRNISNGKTVFLTTSKGDKVKVTRLGSVNDDILFE